MKLILGVLDVAYSDANGGGSATTTGTVASILEANYHVMQTFYDQRKEKIAQYLADDMAAQIQNMVAGGPPPQQRATLTYGADQKIETAFRQFLDADEMNKLATMYGGPPVSAAAAAGVNHRRKNPYAKKNKARPAFIDTGLYRSSMRAWTEK